MDETAEVPESDDDLSEEGRKLMENNYEAGKEATSIKPERSVTGWGFSAPHVRFFRRLNIFQLLLFRSMFKN